MHTNAKRTALTWSVPLTHIHSQMLSESRCVFYFRSDAEQKRHIALWRWWKFAAGGAIWSRRGAISRSGARCHWSVLYLAASRLHGSPWTRERDSSLWKWPAACALKMERQFASFICARPANGCWISRALKNEPATKCHFYLWSNRPWQYPTPAHIYDARLLMASCISTTHTHTSAGPHVICNKAASLWSLGEAVQLFRGLMQRQSIKLRQHWPFISTGPILEPALAAKWGHALQITIRKSRCSDVAHGQLTLVLKSEKTICSNKGSLYLSLKNSYLIINKITWRERVCEGYRIWLYFFHSFKETSGTTPWSLLSGAYQFKGAIRSAKNANWAASGLWICLNCILFVMSWPGDCRLHWSRFRSLSLSLYWIRC